MTKSAEIVASSPDLKRLHQDGFELSIREAHLLVSSVPYVTAARTVARGTLIFALTMATDTVTGRPPNHEAYFAGEYPHYPDGTPIKGMVNREGVFKLAERIVAKIHFSSKPDVADADYEQKVRRYVDLLETQAQVLDKNANARTRRIVETDDDDSPFVYLDTNSARAQISAITSKLKNLKIAIVGLGGTGSYVLDLVAKTPVKEIHLFDDDEFSLHNSYRSPGAPTGEQLKARMSKVDYLKETYTRIHREIVSCPERVTEANVNKLAGMNFVFLCMDPGPDKAQLVTFLLKNSIPFIDTGLGVEAKSDKLIGMVSAIAVTPEYKSHVHKIPVKSPGDDDLYASNIQIAELNALNAVLAVIRWKKYFNFYNDERHEHECSYTIGPNSLINEETPA